jgi:hypothetical protein
VHKLGGDVGIAHHVLAGRTDAHHAKGLSGLFFQPVADGDLGLQFELAPQVGGIADLHIVVVDVQVDRLVSLAPHHDARHVVGADHLVPKVARG